MAARRDKPPTKAQLHAKIAEDTGLTKAQVASVFESLQGAIGDSLRRFKKAAIPGLVNITLKHMPAKPARPGRNPFTGEQMTFKAKPAHSAVRVRALKGLKDLA